MWWDWNNWWWGIGLMVLFAAVFWGSVIALVAWLIIRLTRRESTRGANEKRLPMDIVRERYARGEISKEQFEQIKKDLS